MFQFINEIKKYRNSDKTESDFLDLIKKSKKFGFPLYSLLLIINSSETKDMEICSLDGWVNEDINNQLKKLEKEKMSFEAEKNSIFSAVNDIKKKKLRRILILTISLIIATSFMLVKFVLPEFRANKENELWNKVLNENSVDSFKAYLYAYPNGLYSGKALLNKEQAQEKEDKAKWLKIKESGNKEKYIEFLSLKLKTKRYYVEAKKRIDEINLNKKITSDAGVDDFLGKPSFAVINDPDGYTNLRQGKSVKSKIIGKIYENEQFDVYVEPGNWWLVSISKYNFNGYIHKSRVRIIE